jgi:hypothetical protein
MSRCEGEMTLRKTMTIICEACDLELDATGSEATVAGVHKKARGKGWAVGQKGPRNTRGDYCPRHRHASYVHAANGDILEFR